MAGYLTFHAMISDFENQSRKFTPKVRSVTNVMSMWDSDM